jgi:hypothetical protein
VKGTSYKSNKKYNFFLFFKRMCRKVEEILYNKEGIIFFLDLCLEYLIAISGNGVRKIIHFLSLFISTQILFLF